MNQDNISEKISMLVDDQLDAREALRLMRSLEADSESADVFSRYLLASEVLRSGQPVAYDSAFLKRVHDAIDKEPTLVAPIWRRHLREHSGTLALAATLAGLAIIVGSSVMEQQTRPNIAYAQASLAQSAQVQNYLVTHNESAYIAANGGIMPYLRVVGGGESGR